jgi:hypothetical protein
MGGIDDIPLNEIFAFSFRTTKCKQLAGFENFIKQLTWISHCRLKKACSNRFNGQFWIVLYDAVISIILV